MVWPRHPHALYGVFGYAAVQVGVAWAAVVPVSAGAALFIAECYAFDGPVRYHTSWKIIEENLPRIAAKRILLTHMNGSMLARRHEINQPNILLAEDGLVVEI